ncbi:EcoAI/FtnUII family type I restriction enzme subunit R [Deinococcus radiopugnans]|uniref:DEAD/DEAH box helicase n=1 Tax=Deinococcus radiopugnans ATCC 19172 TaxID=585398 RepID=A0A5C4Y498_9DEIO|nr:DEAD/DEAH box helicase family protein [Deinococcus radiopugnans]MBB6017069.1 type I restriction enzyme R subunit [Deinococcus radiopugnans ATCC 19172]TNM70697.1 DEAD/DEAH box helicase [Deinococcus radiopugnans ATCC 19172]
MDKKKLSERDICTKFITPAVERAGWDILTQVREELYLTKGRIQVSGQLHTRGTPKRADYVLFYKPNIPIAVIEAKDNKHSVGAGLPQGLGYGEILEVPFVFSSNGDAFLFRNNLKSEGVLEKEIALDEFPSPEQLWQWWEEAKGLTPEQARLVTQDYFNDGTDKTPRYYQLLAINKTVEAIAQGQQRLLLVMATGTGKTLTAFQIIWRLWRAGAKKRILFLADRNILVDQTMTNDFKPFGGAMTKIRNRRIDKAFEIYLSLYQAVSGNEEERNAYKQFSPDFFDLIVVDECHRGSAAEDSNWREILEYFSEATQIGLTATPKETETVSNTDYFGPPIYTYSLKQGIDDGFLAPYKVVRFDFDRDLSGWTPQAGQRDRYGHEIDQREYNARDFDRSLVLSRRTELVAAKVSEFLRETDPMGKTIVFCENQEHAERMRSALVNLNPEQVDKNQRYVVRITSDVPDAQDNLDDFISPRLPYPVIATTSKLMSTGVDAQTCKVIVLDQRIQSMTEFKQIIGRGTRVNEDHDKFYFTILDFKGATELFRDPDFDGDPVQVYQPGPGESPVPPADTDGAASREDGWDAGTGDDVTTATRKFYVDGVEVSVAARREIYFDAQGRPITESLKDYSRRTLTREFASLEDFLRRWDDAERKQTIIEELRREGVHFEALAHELGLGAHHDPFDVIAHLVWGRPPLTRRERAARVKKRDAFTRYGETARAVLDQLLDKYADQGVGQLEDREVLKLPDFRPFGTPLEIARAFGGKTEYEQAIRALEDELYSAS